MPFSVRLAAENDWTIEFALRAILEYKRFALLAVTSPEIMTPPDAVDQVWHLHLTFTRSYWENFCPRVLGFALHHEPTQGGEMEEQRFLSAYRATIDRYRAVFGSLPPKDLWPSPEIRFSQRFRRVETAAISRTSRIWDAARTVNRKHALTGLSAIATLLVAGCSGVFTENVASSREAAAFLNFYLSLCVATLALAMWMRRRSLASAPTGRTSHHEKVDVYELAYLARGQVGVLQTVIASLFGAGRLKPGENGTFAVVGGLDVGADRLEKAFVADLRSGKMPESGGRSFRAAVENMRISLETKGLVPSMAETAKLRSRLAYLVFGVLTVGVLRIAYGVQHHHPFGFLMLLMCAFALTGALLFTRPRANVAAARIVKNARQAPGVGEKFYNFDTRIPLVIAVLGPSCLAGNALAEIRHSMERAMPGSGSDGGSGGCGGGGGGGGGGCGGGGGGCVPCGG